MADFSFLSDTDDSAVEDLISQAQELSVLEQISAINCSAFTDPVLPTELETRFRKLKSFPLTKSTPKTSASSPSHSTAHHKPDFNSNNELKNSVKRKNESDSSSSDEENTIFSPGERIPDGIKGLNRESGSGPGSSCLNSLNLSMENALLLASKQNPSEETELKPKSRSGSVSSPSNSTMENAVFSSSKQSPNGKKIFKPKSRHGYCHSLSDSSNLSTESRSPSPPRKTGCFWCSPKRVSRKKGNENWAVGVDLDWGKNDEILSDSNMFSAKEQKRMLKKAMEEQEKISQEAEKIIKWAKQASARMNVSGIEDELSDDDNFK